MVLPSSHEGCKKKPQGIPLDESALRDVEAAAIEQQVLVFETATGRGIDEACDRRLGGTLSVPGIYTKLLDVDKVDLIIGPQSSQPIRSVSVWGMTGGLATNGKSALLAQKIWEEDVNAKGGLLGRPVKLVYYDDQSNPSTPEHCSQHSERSDDGGCRHAKTSGL
jgi:Periplasmic binding protein